MLDGCSTTTLRLSNGSCCECPSQSTSQGFDKSFTPWYTLLPDGQEAKQVAGLSRKCGMKFYLESLGCPKNLVDSQAMSRLLQRFGHVAVSDPGDAQVLIVNTCGFIEDARAESLDELGQLAGQKRDDQLLVAAGCLSQRWGERLQEHVPGIDAMLGTRRWSEIDTLVTELWARKQKQQQSPLFLLGDATSDINEAVSRTAQQGASAYLKIAEGCSAPCAFCAIPLIKGPAVSRPLDAVVEDAIELVRQGAQEITLIGQDTTAYGRDRGEHDALPGLIQAILDAVPKLRWLRLMYAYPGHISPHLIEVMANDPRVCHYLDLPLQHAHPRVLQRMKRPTQVERTQRLIAALRSAMPDIALRTTFIVGYPGETEEEFQALLDFVSEVRFDRVGGFLFSPEEGTAAAALPDPLSQEIKVERLNRLMELQGEISLALNRSQVGRILDVLVEGQGDGLSVARSYRDAPEIDGLVLLPGQNNRTTVGEMVSVRITGAMEYDLVGTIATKKKNKLPAG
jgi:ribosomal protein S12 methylthiotransferase